MRSVQKMLLSAGSLSLLLATACADSANPAAPVESTAPNLRQVTATPTAPTEVAVGDTVYVKASIYKNVTYTVRNGKVMRMLNSSSRRAVALAPGESWIVVTSSDQRTKDSTFVTVRGQGAATPAPGEEEERAPAPAPTPAPQPTPEPTPVAPTTGSGIWMSASEIAKIPMSGAAWSNLKSAADKSCGTPDLADQNQMTNVCVMAKALVFARTGTPSYRTGVTSAIRSIVQSGTYNGRSLALGRELAAYVIAADLIGLKSHDAALDQQFRAKLAQLRTTSTSGGPKNLVECHELRPNNWGTMCGASRVAIAAYLGDKAELDRAAKVLRGYLGDRSAYAGFKYGETSWQCDPSKPVGINPKGCTKGGISLDGVMPDDQRRGGTFAGKATKESYAWEGMQGLITQAYLLSRQGYDVWNWSDRAIFRAVNWLHTQAKYPAEGDDQWQPHLINHVYGTDFPATTGGARPGKIAGFTDWTHR